MPVFDRLFWGYCAMVVLLCCWAPAVQATHIVGGEMNYRCLGNDRYEITLTVFRDCDTGVPWFDSPAYIGIYYGQTQNRFLSQTVDLNQFINDTLDIFLPDPCLTVSTTACIHTTTYTDTILLPFDSRGYTIAYQRCCRNQDIVNIVDPNNTGATYWTYISPLALSGCNNSAVFNEWPRVYLCAGVPILFDHSAVDIDGDSIVYELCTPHDGGTSNNPRPAPANPPPYQSITWQAPYRVNNMFGGSDPLRIDPQTGLLQGTPRTLGVFLVGVCLKEYRNGQLISITRRDFQHIVGTCEPKTRADFSVNLPNCNRTLGFNFPNTSQVVTGSYRWFYDSLATNTNFNGSYVFPDTGQYTVTLVAGLGSPCLDTMTRLVNAQIRAVELNSIPPQTACIGDTVSFTAINQFANYSGPTNFVWQPIADVVRGQGTSTSVFVANTNQTIRVSAINQYGCSDVETVNLNVQQIEADFSFNIPPCNETLTVPFLNQSTSLPTNNDYRWNFGGLGSATSTNPTFSFPDTGQYSVQLIMGSNTLCPDTITQQVNLQLSAVKLLSLPNLQLCLGDEVGIRARDVFSNYGGPTSYTWRPSSILLNGQGTDTINLIANTTTPVTVVATNGDGCSDSLTFDLTTVEVAAGLDTLNLACNTSLTVPFLNRSTTNLPNISYQWDAFGVGSSTSTNPIFTFPDTGSYTVQLIAGVGSFCPDTTLIDLYLPLYGVLLQGLTSPVACIGDSVWLSVNDALSAYSNSIQYTWSTTGNVANGLNNDSLLIVVDSVNSIDVRVDAINSHLCPDSLFTTIAVQIHQAAFDTLDLVCNTSLNIPFLNRSLSNQSSTTYAWQTSSGDNSSLDDPTFIFPDTGVYTVQLIAGAGTQCPDTVKQMFYLPLEGLDLNANNVTVFCKGDTVKLIVIDALERYSSSVQYQWSPATDVLSGQGTDRITAYINQPNTVFQVIGVNNYGCIDTAEAIGNITYPSPVLTISANPDSIFLGQQTQLLATDNLNYTYNWLPDTTLSALDIYDPTARPKQTQWYVLTVGNSLGCTTTDSILIHIKAPICGEPVLFVPNAFSPDGDGYNDQFFINGNNITDMTLEIYNRWGQQVFATNNQLQGWDGTFNGAELPPDVYGYYIRCVCDDGTTFFKKGNIMLLR